jgi:N-acetylneuraminate synthase
LDRSMWGSDQAASIEPQGLARLVRDVRVISEAMGDGVKRIYDGERAAMKKLRRIPGELADHVDLAAVSGPFTVDLGRVPWPWWRVRHNCSM